tara:strand:+ start:22350 stop:23825 length:1476 start_codon:yes stop_codon:yes gene_type:complete
MRNIALVLIIIAVISVSAAVATVRIVNQRIAEDDKRISFEQQIWELEKNRVTNALSDTIDMQDIIKGFWLEHTSDTGEMEVVLVSVDGLAAQNLSMDELEQVVADIDNGRIIRADNAKLLSEDELSENLQFHNEVYASLSGGVSTKEMLEDLQMRVREQGSSSADLSSLAYLYELEGNYGARDALNAEGSCESCRKKIAITISGSVVDLKGEPVQGAVIDVLGVNEATVHTDSNGLYTITISTFVPGKVRVSALKRNFSDGVMSVNTVSKNKTFYKADPIIIADAVSIVTIDTQNKTVSGSRNEVREDGVFVVRTDQSTYEIPAGAIVHKSGIQYKGEVDVYLYEFSQGNIPEGLIQVDTFDDVRGFAGDLMKTFGMPFIQFFSSSGEELHVLRSNSMVLTYKIANMNELRRNTLAIYSPLTNEDMKFLVDISSKSPRAYPIDREFLIENQLLRFPAFWVYDRRAGIWNSVGISVLDTSGTIKSEFYTIKN